jgi:Zn-dependent protease
LSLKRLKEIMETIVIFIQKMALFLPPILFAVTVHEVAHGWMAYRLGDPTAKMAGRLTLNPLKHLDFLGTLVFFLTQAIGWAKPVPIDSRYFKRPGRDMMLVALAGPASNLLTAAISVVLVRFIGPLLLMQLPVPQAIWEPLFYMGFLSVQLNIALAVFNLIPIPPLDGSKVLAGLLPYRLAMQYQRLEPFGFLLLLLLIFTGSIERFFLPVVKLLNAFFLGR